MRGPSVTGPVFRSLSPSSDTLLRASYYSLMRRFRRDQAADDRVAAELAAHADSLSARMLEVTVPMYLAAPPAEPMLVGSGVLVSLAEDRFLLTAAHVLAWRHKGQLVAAVSPDLMTLAGTLWEISAPTADTRLADNIDLGLVRLAGGPWNGLSLGRFCSWDELDTQPSLMARHSFGVVGFPVSKNRRPVLEDRLRSFALPLAGLECDAATYVEVGRNPDANLMIGFDRKTMSGTNGRKASPDLNGVSGGGMWRFGRKLREATRPPLLSAIAIEWHQGKHKYILGTRIQIALAMMIENLPNVREFVGSRIAPPAVR
jgi:hypothetical protein